MNPQTVTPDPTTVAQTTSSTTSTVDQPEYTASVAVKKAIYPGHGIYVATDKEVFFTYVNQNFTFVGSATSQLSCDGSVYSRTSFTDGTPRITCNSFQDCMEICVRTNRSSGSSSGTDYSIFCRAVSYTFKPGQFTLPSCLLYIDNLYGCGQYQPFRVDTGVIEEGYSPRQT